MGKKNEAGTVIGNKKIFCLKFADDIGIVADHSEGLQLMLKGLERYGDRNEMVVNVKKTKIMVFRNGGRLCKDEKWTYKNERVETVNTYK